MSPRIAIDVLTLFPGMFSGYFDESIMKRAREKGIVALAIHNLRDWATDAHHSVDDKPYGGGAGMVMMAPIIDAAVDALRRKNSHLVLLSPQGKTFTHDVAEALSKRPRLILLSGHYEGIDERAREFLVDEEISIGDYVISNGSLASMILIDAVVRLIPGVVGDERSVMEDSYSQGILDYPHYTRPREYKGLSVPEILLKGDHEKVRIWRRREALKRTLERRPDLLRTAPLTEEDREIIRELKRDH